MTSSHIIYFQFIVLALLNNYLLNNNNYAAKIDAQFVRQDFHSKKKDPKRHKELKLKNSANVKIYISLYLYHKSLYDIKKFIFYR